MESNVMKHKVLLLDDNNESLLRSLGNSFSAETYEVVLGENALEAIEKSDAGEIGLLVMNLNSPTDEGWEAIDEITEENPFLPIIVITRQPELRNLAEAAGVCAFVEMPVDVPTLLQTIPRATFPSVATLRVAISSARHVTGTIESASRRALFDSRTIRASESGRDTMATIRELAVTREA